MAALREFTVAMLKELKAQFIVGTAPGGDRTGTNPTASQVAQGYIPTIDTFRIDNQVPGMWSRIRMDGAASYIEMGTAEHTIQPIAPGGVLAFEWAKMGGDQFFFKSVDHPTVAADPFVERAMQRVELESFLATIASNTFIRLFNPLGGWRPGGISLGGTDPFGKGTP